MRMRDAVLVLASAALTAAVGAGTAAAAPKSGADVNLWSPKGFKAGVEKSWTGDGHKGYNGQFAWLTRSGSVWVEVRISWESGGLEQKKVTFGKQYSYKGAYEVYLRACDSSGCGGWW
ncbi:hypothetical protein ACFXPX_05330 [Kitasatospora sp. NPDC059146]|uniref:hypothetical protein n=1 Tax=unclassified Kitasatospora TaxID=2633591 RepID=UPI003689F19B